MMINTRQLAGEDLAKKEETNTVVTKFYTRLKAGGSAPTSKDNVAWCWDGDADPSEVFRSIFHPEEWIDRQTHQFEMKMLKSPNVAFTGRRGHALFNRKLQKGEIVWFNVPGKHFRKAYLMLEDEHVDSGAERHGGDRRELTRRELDDMFPIR